MSEKKEEKYKILNEITFKDGLRGLIGISTGYQIVIKIEGKTAVIVTIKLVGEGKNMKYNITFKTVNTKYDCSDLSYNINPSDIDSSNINCDHTCKDSCKTSCNEKKMRDVLIKEAIPYIVEVLE